MIEVASVLIHLRTTWFSKVQFKISISLIKTKPKTALKHNKFKDKMVLADLG